VGPARGSLVALGVLASLAAGCGGPRIVPVPAADVQVLDGTTVVAAGGVELAVRPSSWRGSPYDLPSVVTPFWVRVTNGAAVPLSYDYPGFRLFDDARFQYTALPPVEVERIMRSRVEGAAPRVATVGPLPLRHRFFRDPFWDPWWWGGYYDPWYYAPPRLDDIYLRALPVGVVQPGARVEGFVYFPRLRPDATRLTLEFHHWLGAEARALVLPFGIERSEGGATAPS
jgi:hypothetical protein